MILSGKKIREEIDAGRILVDPFREELISHNSLDVRLGAVTHVLRSGPRRTDPYQNSNTQFAPQPLGYREGDEEVWRLNGGRLYLATTLEAVGTAPGSGICPDMCAKSTAGRWGLTVALCAGLGEVGYYAQWTLEIRPVENILLRRGTTIGQVRFTRVDTAPEEVVDYGSGDDSYQPGGEVRVLPKPLKVLL